MAPDRFLDGRVFDPSDIVAYLARCEHSELRFSLAELGAAQRAQA
jgi:hypothetical protein